MKSYDISNRMIILEIQFMTFPDVEIILLYSAIMRIRGKKTEWIATKLTRNLHKESRGFLQICLIRAIHLINAETLFHSR